MVLTLSLPMPSSAAWINASHQLQLTNLLFEARSRSRPFFVPCAIVGQPACSCLATDFIVLFIGNTVLHAFCNRLHHPLPCARTNASRMRGSACPSLIIRYRASQVG